MTSQRNLYDPEPLIRAAILDEKRRTAEDPKVTDAEVLNWALAADKSPITIRRIMSGTYNKIVLDNLAEAAEALGLEMRVTFVPKGA